ncbi:hypothetical protein [Oceanicoccus sagamiensis]|uniref:hypothetical protein n=1 Tax=Oceanicoccus sagamiensis TaxID=716816 RepID=UPI00197DA4EF|nr:hypothetical protein [Oceanicoccus sagamiensis]
MLDDNIERCAQYHCDKHVAKMILESVQILCTALNKKAIATPYKSTHIKHPCVLWAEQSYDNFEWLCYLTQALNTEYRWRYNKPKDHASIAVLKAIEPHRFERNGLLPFAQAMPDSYKQPDNAVAAYRQFYCQDKASFARWTKRATPAWFLYGQAN